MTRSVLVLTIIALAGCSERGQAPDPTRMTTPVAAPDRPDLVIGGNVIPQSHEFPAGRVEDIRRLFAQSAMSYPIAVVGAQGPQTQFVNPKPVFIGDHRFVVGAPPALHAAMDRLIASLDQSTPQVSSTYELTFWVVEATAGANVDVARDLAEVAPMLEKLAGIGKRRFRSLDRVAARSRDGTPSTVLGRMIRVDHKLAALPDGIELELQLQLQGTWSDKPEAGPRVETTLHLPLGEPIVIGDSTQTAASDGQANLLLYVVRARRVD